MKFRWCPTAFAFLIALVTGASALAAPMLACRDLFRGDRKPPAATSIEQDTSLGMPISIRRITGMREQSHFVRLLEARLEPKEDEVVIGFSLTPTWRWSIGHAFLMTAKYRLDGSIVRRPVNSGSLLSENNAVLFRFKLSSPEEAEELNRLIRHDGESPFRGFRLSCVHAACAPLARAQSQLPIKNFVLLSSAFQYLLGVAQAPRKRAARFNRLDRRPIARRIRGFFREVRPTQENRNSDRECLLWIRERNRRGPLAHDPALKRLHPHR